MNEARLKMELHKVEREIKIHGESYTVKREKLDERNESTGTFEEIKDIKAIFHVVKSYMSKRVSDGTTTRTKGQPMLLMTYEGVSGIQNGDIVIINDQQYCIVDMNNIQEYNIVVDASLELVLNGNI